jgi:hypothetical protein
MNQLTPGRNLKAEMLGLIAHVTSRLGETSPMLQRQAEAATVVRPSATMLDGAVPADIPAVDLPDGPVPGSSLICDHEELVGELLVWVRDDRLIGVEQAWCTDDPPQSWPPPEMVRVS